jgi:hypothetical protein
MSSRLFLEIHLPRHESDMKYYLVYYVQRKEVNLGNGSARHRAPKSL